MPPSSGTSGARVWRALACFVSRSEADEHDHGWANYLWIFAATPGESFGKARQGFCEHECSLGDVVWGRVFVGAMAEATAAWNKQHGHRRDARDKQRIVIGATRHGEEPEAVLFAGIT